LGYWGIKSYEVDEAHDALDAAFEAVHGAAYDDLMDDRNPMTLEQIQQRLADPRTLAEAVRALEGGFGGDPEGWDEVERLAFAGVVVRHAELGVPIPGPWRDRAVAWLEAESIEWDEPTKRRLRRDRELEALRRAETVAVPGGAAS
jgi:hypothetical protein